MNRPIIEVSGLSKSYQLGSIGATSLKDEMERFWRWARGRQAKQQQGEFMALSGVSFKAQKGEVLGIIGRNGAGKSTLLKILSRITQQTKGEIILRGRVASLLEVGTGFHPELTGRENTFLNGAILGMSKVEIRKKFDEIVAFAEVEQFLDTPVKRYSSGMYVKLAFAVAAHLDPEILIVDEVLAVGDVQFQKKCIGKMEDVASKEGRTVLFVSHNMTAITAFCHRAILLSKGQIVMDGPAREVTEAYQLESMENAGDGDLMDNLHRTGTGAARFTSLTFQAINPEGKHVSFLYPGCDLAIDIEIESAADAITGANVAVIVYDSSGSRLIDVNTGLRDEYLDLAARERASIRFILNDVLLAAGTYYIGLWLGRQGVEVFDHLESAKSLRVVDDPEQTKHAYNFPGRYRCRFETLTRKQISSEICA